MIKITNYKYIKYLFTLIELLIVVGVIAILISILLPALKMARDKSQGILCFNNLKQQHLGLTEYANDHDGYFPNVGVCYDTWIYFLGNGWMQTGFLYCYGYMGEIDTAANNRTERNLTQRMVFYCPSSKWALYGSAGNRSTDWYKAETGDSTVGINCNYFFRSWVDENLVDYLPPKVFANRISKLGKKQCALVIERVQASSTPYMYWHNKGYHGIFVDGHTKWLSKNAVSKEGWTLFKDGKYKYKVWDDNH